MTESSASQALRDRVLMAARASSSPTRAQANRTLRLALFSSVLIAAMTFHLDGGLMNARARPLGIGLPMIGGCLIMACVLSRLLVQRTRTGMTKLPKALVFAALALPLALFVWQSHFHGLYREPFHAQGYECLRYTLIVAALPFAALQWRWHGLEPRYPALFGAGIGSVTAAWAALAVAIWCPLSGTSHLVLGHITPVVVITALGATLGAFGLRTHRVKSSRHH